jgi:Fe-S oxidoreductase
MCPSWKATRERRHSPKGRASLMREWLRRLADAAVDPAQRRESCEGVERGLPGRVAP